jgi:hypothetical protein
MCQCHRRSLETMTPEDDNLQMSYIYILMIICSVISVFIQDRSIVKCIYIRPQYC